MAIKRKTHLNLSGSHHTLDSDNAFVGGTVYVTGSVSASIGKFQQLTGSLSGTLGGSPFLVAGSNMGGVNYNAATGQWEITGSAGTSVAGTNGEVQFNENGVHGAASDAAIAQTFSYYTGSYNGYLPGTLVAPTASFQYLSGGLANAPFYGTELGFTSPVLGIDSNVLVTQSLMVFDGTTDLGFATLGGPLLVNGAGITMFSGSVGNQPDFGVSPDTTPGLVQVNVRGFANISSGSLIVRSGSAEDSFVVEPTNTAGQVNAIFDRFGSVAGVPFGGINVRPLYATMATNGASGVEMSGTLLTNISTGPNSIGKIDLNVIAVQQDSDDYGSWTFSTTIARDSLNALKLIAYSELDAATSGSNAAGWDVNINDDTTIQCTGSAGGSIQWYAQITKKMFLSGSGLITY